MEKMHWFGKVSWPVHFFCFLCVNVTVDEPVETIVTFFYNNLLFSVIKIVHILLYCGRKFTNSVLKINFVVRHNLIDVKNTRVESLIFFHIGETMKKTILTKLAGILAAFAFTFTGCNDVLSVDSEIASEASRATISATSSLYSTDLTKSATFTAKTTAGNYTIYATSDKKVTVPAISAVTVNGKSLDRKLSLGGGGSAGSYRCVGFTTSGSATLTVYAAGASGRYLALTNSSGTVLQKGETASDIKGFTYSVPSSGTYYLMSTGSNIDLYYIKCAVGSSSSSGSTSSGSTSSGSTSSSSTSTSSSNGGSLSINDKPVGFASVSKPSSTVTVSSRSDFINYAKKGGYVIYVNGMIDLSDGYLPTSAGGSTSKLDALVKSNTSSKYTSYSSFKTAYAKGCSTSTDDKSSSSPSSSLGKHLWACNTAYGNIIKVNVASNTWIVGKTSSSGLKGGSLNISSVSNVVLRNLTIQDAYDPFPHHEKDDGYNAQWDGIVIQGSSKNIWIDHCTLKDTMGYSTVSTGGSTSEKWQTYDGLLDMKGSISGITISWCKFQDHDKTMLIGSSDSDGSNSTRTITLHHNYFYNCGQRLPMVRNTKLHMFNNYYDASNPRYKQQYAVGCRAGSLIVAENNTFGSGIYYSFKDNYGKLYASGNSDSSQKKNSTTISSSKPFTPSYSYSLDSASTSKSNVQSNAGAGKSM